MEGTNLQPGLGVDDRAQMGKRALFWKNLAKSGVAPLCQTFAVRDFAHFPIEPLGGRAVDAKDTMRGAAGGGCDAAVAREGPGRAPPGWAPGRRGRQRQQHECGGRQQQHSTAFTPVGRRHPQNDGTSRGGSMTLHFCCGRDVWFLGCAGDGCISSPQPSTTHVCRVRFVQSCFQAIAAAVCVRLYGINTKCPRAMRDNLGITCDSG